jgi:L-fuconolactonase
VLITIKEDWLSATREEIVDPDRRIIDPHHHFFAQSPMFPHYDLNDLWRDTSGHRIEKTVFMQCWQGYRVDGPDELKPVGETELVDGIARVARREPNRAQIAGIIGAADLRLGARVREVIEAHAAASKLFKGIRHMAVWDSAKEVLSLDEAEEGRVYSNPKFREGLAVLQSMDFVFESWLYHPHISTLTDLARAFPETRIVLDHMGTPLGVGPYAGRRDEVFQKWSRDLAELARCPNVTLKLGGLLMPWNGFGLEERPRAPTSAEIVSAQRHYYDFAIEVFGAKRCMFQSNFPIEKGSCSYDVLWNAFKRMTKDYSESEKDDLFYTTAANLYRL